VITTTDWRETNLHFKTLTLMFDQLIFRKFMTPVIVRGGSLHSAFASFTSEVAAEVVN